MFTENTVQVVKKRKQLNTATQQQYLSQFIETQENIYYQHIYNFKIGLVVSEHHCINFTNYLHPCI